MRLDKFISNNSEYSRQDVKKLIRNSKVKVNGKYTLDPSLNILNKDEVKVNNNIVFDQSNTTIYIDKPKGYITSTSDKEGLSVMELIPSEYKHLNLKPIGRLDKDTTGILLFTNNNKLIHEMTSKNNNFLKTYLVTLADDIQDHYADEIKKGILLKDGYKTLSGKFEIINKKQCKISIYDGKYHQVKRMFAAMGNKVIELRRISFGKYKI